MSMKGCALAKTESFMWCCHWDLRGFLGNGLLPKVSCQSYDKNNEVKMCAVDRSPAIYLIGEENLN